MEKPPLQRFFLYKRGEESLLAKEYSLALVNYVLDLPYRQVKLLRKWLITDPVEQSSP